MYDDDLGIDVETKLIFSKKIKLSKEPREEVVLNTKEIVLKEGESKLKIFSIQCLSFSTDDLGGVFLGESRLDISTKEERESLIEAIKSVDDYGRIERSDSKQLSLSEF